jgi:SAM-dependent methyltransferase
MDGSGDMISQREVQDWFDGIYRDRGLSYLRPFEAYRIFLDLVAARAGERLLDIACGPGLLLRDAVGRGIDAHGIDISEIAAAMVGDQAPGSVVSVASAEALPYPDASFDLLTCIGAVERFLDRDRALGEFRRVLRPGGRLCIMVRNARTLSWLGLSLTGRRNRAGHQDADTLEGWTRLLGAAGFSVRRVLPDLWAWQRLGIVRPGRPVGGLTRLMPLRFANEFIFVLENRP